MLDPTALPPAPAEIGLVQPPAPSIAALQGREPFGVPVRITHDGEEDLRFAIVPLPSYPAPQNTLAQRKGAISVSYSGRLAEAVDLYRSTVLQDGFFDGILRTMAEGILQLPLSFAQGTDEMRSALLNADGTAGDWAAMHPLEECAQIMKDGLVGFPGLGQYLLMCWQCGWTDHDRVVADLEEGTGGSGTFEICQRCRARRDQRPLGKRELYRLEWRDCRWLDQNPVTFQWYYTGRNGRVPIIDGDGEWFMFWTTPKLESWRHGNWIWASLYAVFSRDAMYDAQNTSQVCAPTPVLNAKKPVAEATRAAAEQRIRQLGFDNRIVLNGEWEYNIVSAKAEYKDICTDIVTRCSDAFETGVTGNVMGRAARTAFTDAGIYKRTTAERRGAAAGLWTRQTREKGLVHWGRDNYGTREVPVGALDCRSPEDKLADARSLEQIGSGVKALVVGLAAAAVRPTQAWVSEYLQQAGIRVEPVPLTSKLEFDPKDRAGYVLMDEARSSDDLPPLPEGDPRKTMMVAAAIKSGGPAAPVGATLEAAPAAAAIGGAAAPSPTPASPPPPAARLEDEEDCDPEDEDCDEDSRRAELAAGLAGSRTCEHGRTHACERCGVRRVYGAPVPGPDGKPSFPVSWRPLARTGPRARRRARRAARLGTAHALDDVTPRGPDLDDALDALDDALDDLDDLYDEDEEGALRARAEQLRGPDGKFLATGTKPKTHDAQGRPIVAAAGTKDGLGRSKAAGVARKGSTAARAASAKAQAGGSHEDAAKAHLDAAAQHREAAKASSRADYRAAHEAAAKAHEDVATAHQAERAATGTVAPQTPEHLAAAVQAHLATLPHDDAWGTDVPALRAGVAVTTKHIESRLPSMSDEERGACESFSGNYFTEMRALERGVSAAELVAARAKGVTEADAKAHVGEAAAALPHFHAALAKLETTQPPPPDLFRGMGVSDRTLHELLTRGTYSTAGMSSSASLIDTTASSFAANTVRGQRLDYRGERCVHAVICKISRARSSPIMHDALSGMPGEREMVLRRDASYTITHRSRDTEGRVVIHMSED